VAVGTGVVAGGGVCAVAGSSCATWPVSSASCTMATAIAIAAIVASTPATISGPRHPGAATTRVPTAAPHARHHSCSSVIGAPQRGHWRLAGSGCGSGAAGGGVSVALTGAAPS
jgi:hypothetical protein